MAISPADKVLLRKFRAIIEAKFERYKSRRPRMALYFNSKDRVYITFGLTENFPLQFFWRTNRFRYIAQYDTAKAVGPQTDALLDA